MTNPKFTISKSGSNHQFYYNLKAQNGEKILSGEGYTTKQSCLTAISAVKINAPFDSRYDRRTATSGHHYFVLKAANGEIIGNSEMYNSSAAREVGIASVKRDAPGAPIEDLT